MNKNYINQIVSKFSGKGGTKVFSVEDHLSHVVEITTNEDTPREEVPPLYVMSPFSVYTCSILDRTSGNTQVFSCNVRPKEAKVISHKLDAINGTKTFVESPYGKNTEKEMNIMQEILLSIKNALPWFSKRINSIYKASVLNTVQPINDTPAERKSDIDLQRFVDAKIPAGKYKGASVLDLALEPTGKKLLAGNIEYYGKYPNNKDLVKVMQEALKNYEILLDAAKKGNVSAVANTNVITVYDTGIKYFPSKKDDAGRYKVYRMLITYDWSNDNSYPFQIRIGNGYAPLKVTASGTTQIMFAESVGYKEASVNLNWDDMYDVWDSIKQNTDCFMRHEYARAKKMRDKYAWNGFDKNRKTQETGGYDDDQRWKTYM